MSSPLAQLVESARSGDPQAFSAILEHFAVRMMLYIHGEGGRLFGSDFDGEDVFQTVAARAWDHLPTFEFQSERALHAWLRIMVDHVLGDRVRYLRGKGRERARASVDLPTSGREPLDPATSVASLAARREALDRVRIALDRLDGEDRRLVVAHLVEDRSFTEIAAELGVSRSTAFQRVQRAVSGLRSLLPGGKGSEP